MNNQPQETPNLTIVITTYNKVEDVMANLQRLKLVQDIIHKIFVIDQGDTNIDAKQIDPEFVTLIRQPNFGGSGGFARGLVEAVADSKTEYILLLDDDAVIHPESIRKAYSYAIEHPRTIVGGQMWATDNKSAELVPKSGQPNFGELVNRRIWGLEPQRNPQEKVDFTGWWMTLLPRAVVDEIGLPFPLFLKWDDAEYGLRASAAGYALKVLDGVGIWHDDWRNTPQRFGWQSYFWQRNKFIVALLYAREVPYFAIWLNWLTLIKLLLTQGNCEAYQIRELGLKDLFKPPSELLNLLGTKQPEIRRIIESKKRTKFSWYSPIKAFNGRIRGIFSATKIHLELLKEWQKLRNDYRIAFPNLIKPENYRKLWRNPNMNN
jgi:galactofuranosylgalactofuranosylrhamnosyl-N-acetylglucosaminyl-diphospho-decaprenol beta-1,5/1,6-galactofuranosyltransferase